MALKADSNYVDLYRGQEVWFNYIIEVYWANVEGKYLLQNFTMSGLTSDIDDTLDILYPPAPGGSILSQLFNETKAWVTSNIRGWVEQWGQVYENVTTYLGDTLNYWGDQINQYIDDSITYWGDYIAEQFVDARTYIDDSINYWGDIINNTGDNITKVYKNTIGASIEWVNERFQIERDWTTWHVGEVVPEGFVGDPEGYIKSITENFVEYWIFGAITSFGEGFEEGLAEEIEG